MRKAEELYMKHIYAMEGQAENNQNSPLTSDVTINKVNTTKNQANTAKESGGVKKIARSH